MGRWVRSFAVVSFAAASMVHLGCDLDLTPFAEPKDGGVAAADGAGGSGPTEAGATAAPDAADASAEADVVVDAGTMIRRVFVTSSTTPGGMGGVDGADRICRKAGEALGGTFVAWISVTGQPALLRIPNGTAYFLVDGKTRVFADKTAITTSGPEVPINRDENGKPVENAAVWTGTLSTGGPSLQNCADFTSGGIDLGGLAGSAQGMAQQWTEASTPACFLPARLYCFEQ